MLRYKIIPRKNPQTKNVKYYPALVSPMPVNLNKIAEEIEKISSLSRGDIKNVLDNLQHVVINHLQEGRSVRLGELGSFRLSLRASGSLSEQDVTANNVKSVRPLFTPSVEMRDALKPSKVDFVKVVAPSAPIGG